MPSPLAWTAAAAIFAMQSFAVELPSVEGPTLSILFSFRESLAPAVFTHMQSETAALLARAQVQVEWYPRASGLVVPGHVVVLTVLGACGEQYRGAHAYGRTLGWSEVSSGEVLPFITIHCSRVAGYVDAEIPESYAGLHDRLLGRAMARIFVHELHHYLVNSDSHTRAPLMAPALSVRELIGDNIRLQSAEIARIGDALRAQ